MNYKLVCIDMDGTLLDSHHKVSERNKEALKKSIEKEYILPYQQEGFFRQLEYMGI